jgi:Ca2+-dependent lipid-binding protein
MFYLRFAIETPQLSVTLVGAHGLFAADFGGKSDPFAIIRLGATEFVTETLNKTLDPEWNQTFLFDVEERNDNSRSDDD